MSKIFVHFYFHCHKLVQKTIPEYVGIAMDATLLVIGAYVTDVVRLEEISRKMEAKTPKLWTRIRRIKAMR